MKSFRLNHHVQMRRPIIMSVHDLQQLSNWPLYANERKSYMQTSHTHILRNRIRNGHNRTVLIAPLRIALQPSSAVGAVPRRVLSVVVAVCVRFPGVDCRVGDGVPLYVEYAALDEEVVAFAFGRDAFAVRDCKWVSERVEQMIWSFGTGN
jgi:hypothetical protein